MLYRWMLAFTANLSVLDSKGLQRWASTKVSFWAKNELLNTTFKPADFTANPPRNSSSPVVLKSPNTIQICFSRGIQGNGAKEDTRALPSPPSSTLSYKTASLNPHFCSCTHFYLILSEQKCVYVISKHYSVY